jgi:hypothetical protein
MFFFVLTKKEKKHLRWIFFEKKEERKKHTPGDYKVLFSCVRVQKKRVERLNPKRQRQNFYLRKTEQKRNKAKEIKSTNHTHTHVQNGMRTKKNFFLVFFKSLQKSRRYKRERMEHTHTHTHIHTTFSFHGFFSDIFS